MEGQQMALQFAEATKRLELAEKQFAANQEQFTQQQALAEKRYQLDLDIRDRENKIKDIQLQQLQDQQTQEQEFQKAAGPIVKSATELAFSYGDEDEARTQQLEQQFINRLSGLSGPQAMRAAQLSGQIMEAARVPANVWASKMANATPIQAALDVSGMKKFADDAAEVVNTSLGIDPKQLNDERERQDNTDRTALADEVQVSTAAMQQLGVMQAGLDVASLVSGNISAGITNLHAELLRARGAVAERQQAGKDEALKQIQTHIDRLENLQRVRKVNNQKYETRIRFQTHVRGAVGSAVTQQALTMGGASKEQISGSLGQLSGGLVEGIKPVMRFVDSMFDAPSTGTPRPASVYLTAETPETRNAAAAQLRTEATQNGLTPEQIDLLFQKMDGMEPPPTVQSAGQGTKSVPKPPTTSFGGAGGWFTK
jgi:hypothetical protein